MEKDYKIKVFLDIPNPLWLTSQNQTFTSGFGITYDLHSETYFATQNEAEKYYATLVESIRDGSCEDTVRGHAWCYVAVFGSLEGTDNELLSSVIDLANGKTQILKGDRDHLILNFNDNFRPLKSNTDDWTGGNECLLRVDIKI